MLSRFRKSGKQFLHRGRSHGKRKVINLTMKKGNMEGAEFAIHAKGNHLYGRTERRTGNRIVKYEKRCLVARMVTDKEGKGSPE